MRRPYMNRMASKTVSRSLQNILLCRALAPLRMSEVGGGTARRSQLVRSRREPRVPCPRLRGRGARSSLARCFVSSFSCLEVNKQQMSCVDSSSVPSGPEPPRNRSGMSKLGLPGGMSHIVRLMWRPVSLKP